MLLLVVQTTIFTATGGQGRGCVEHGHLDSFPDWGEHGNEARYTQNQTSDATLDRTKTTVRWASLYSAGC